MRIRILFSVAVLTLIGCKTAKQTKHPKKEKKHSTVSPVTHSSGQRDSVRVEQDHTQGVPIIKDTRYYYERAFEQLKTMLENPQQLSFKKAVFISENAYYGEELNEETFNKSIESFASMAKVIYPALKLKDYNYPDSVKVLKNWAIFTLMKDSTFLLQNMPLFEGFRYNFEDYTGKKDWSSHFVTSLIDNKVGNCHSLPYMYKILADELQTEAFLSIAPNHVYIKHRNKKFGWYNTELTSGQFPTDAWVKCSGYITLEAIRSGIYMDTLSYRQSIALCAYDLAKSYIAKTKKNGHDFVINCCDLTLKYYPNCVNAMLLKAETIKAKFDWARKQDDAEKAKEYLDLMEPIYVACLNLGYREMPEEVYQVWLHSINEQKENFENQRINNTFEKQ